jgi:hypothetical protein
VTPCRSCGAEHTGPGSRDVPGAIAKVPAEPLGDEDVDVTYVFPCDVDGRVNLDALSETGRNHYFFVASELSVPTVRLTSAA